MMSEFKSQAEVWQALLDGETVCSQEYRYKFFEGRLLESINLSEYNPSWQTFVPVERFTIYTEPKTKKVVRMAPVLRFVDNRYFISDEVFASQDSAICHYKDNSFKFVKWLIDTHGVDVEVDED